MTAAVPMPIRFRPKALVTQWLPVAALCSFAAFEGNCGWNEVDSRNDVPKDIVRISDLGELRQQVSKIEPGRILLLEDGVYRSTDVLQLRGIPGTAERPVVIAAKNRGKVTFEVGGFLLAESSFVTIEGIVFGGPFTAKADRALVTLSSNTLCRITRCEISPRDTGGTLKAGTRYSFLQLGGGASNRVDHTVVRGKNSMGPMVVIRPSEKAPLLEFNRFTDFAYGKENGYEGLQLGNDCRYRMHALIRSNWFENMDGEAEVISVKTTGNIITGNTFLNNRGEVVVRAANETVISSNLFWNREGKKGVGGIRNQGDDTFITSNVFIGTETGVQTQCGDTAVDFPAGVQFYAPAPEALEKAYRQSRRVQVLTNIMIDVASPFSFKPADIWKKRSPDGTEESIPKDLPPTGWRIAGNRIQSQGGGLLVRGSGEVGFSWDENVAAGYDEKALGRSFSPAQVRVESKSLFEKKDETKWVDADGSPLNLPGVRFTETGHEIPRS